MLQCGSIKTFCGNDFIELHEEIALGQNHCCINTEQLGFNFKKMRSISFSRGCDRLRGNMVICFFVRATFIQEWLLGTSIIY